ncbi:MAG: hypothetical protein JO301_11650 [Chitinophagaceae bacterium]|nr:hypothetical protein [Chitinophagaceae bacterium]
MKPVSKGIFDVKAQAGISFVAAVFVAICWFMIQSAVSVRYIQIDNLIAGSLISILCLLGSVAGFDECKAVDIYENHLQLKWVWGLIRRRLPATDIELFSKTNIDKKDYLILRTPKRDIRFLSSFTSNEQELIETLRSWKIRRKDNTGFNQRSVTEKVFGVILMGLSLPVLIFTCKLCVEPDAAVTRKELATVSGILKMRPDIKKSTAKSSSQYISFTLREYPEFKFEIGSVGYDATKISALAEFNYGAKASFRIPLRDLATKIQQTAEPTFLEKHFNWTTIPVYDAVLNSRQVLALDDYYTEKRLRHDSEKKWCFVGIAVSVLFFWGGLKLFRQEL